MSVPISAKRHVHNVVLCYHGCVLHRADALTFREHIDDWKAQIRALQRQGYTFVLPSQYLAWYNGTWTPPGPIACCHLDDGLASIEPICDWMVGEGIPFGLAIIGRRQRKHEPEDGFASWELLKRYTTSGVGELLNHTYNMHHLTLVNKNQLVDVSPVMEAPCWLDNGDVVYRLATDTRYYWDFSHVDTAVWGFPLYGSDPFTNWATPITSTLTVRAKWTGTLRVLRLWQALGRPYGGGYNAQVEVRINNALVWSGTIMPKDYGTRQQWVEREFYSITLTTPVAITSGQSYTIQFKTLNAGIGCALIYVLPDLGGTFSCNTTCQGLVVQPVGFTAAMWPAVADFPANYNWPARPAIILADGTGATASDAAYQAYIQADLQTNNQAISDWLNAAWTFRAQNYNTNLNDLGVVVIGGQYSDGTLADTVIPFDCPATHVAQTLRWKNAGAYGLERYPMLLDISYATSSTGPWTFLTRYASRWKLYHWEEVDIPATSLTGGTRYWFRFQTLNANPFGGAALQRAYQDVVFHYNQTIPSGWAWWDFSGIDYALNRRTAIVSRREGSDVWPTGPTSNRVFAGWQWEYTQNSLAGNTYLETMSAAQTPTAAPAQMIYPFGSLYEQGAGGINVNNIKQVSVPLQNALTAAGCNCGFTIYPARYEKDAGVFREPSNRYTRYTLGRLLVYGTVAPQVTLSHLDAYAGTMFNDAQHSGVRWQISMEPDPAGNATIKHSVAALDFVAFDAWSFDGLGNIQKGVLNDGGTYLEVTGAVGTFQAGETVTEAVTGATAQVVWWSTVGVLKVQAITGTWTGGKLVSGGTSLATATGVLPGPVAYVDDKTWLQSRGVRCLLILNNNLGTGDPNAAIGGHVVNNPAIYVPLIVAAAAGWDGITCNLEAVPAINRAAATAFYQQLSTALHAAGKLLHATSPATTGTAYDAAWWTDWCDHNELAKCCDAVKVMTYTETGPGSAPGSASPDWHFTACLNYLRDHVYSPFWPRLMLGARAFGHLWHDTANPLNVSYVSYADGMAAGMVAGAEIIPSDGEAYWQAGISACWFGTPDTVLRSARAAAARGFGGVGVWMADAGDLYEHWPLWPQIGVDKMAGFSEERFRDDWSWFAVGGPKFKTHITAGDSDYESRIGVGDLGLRRYSLSHTLTNQAEVDWFLAFWMLRHGPLDGFRMKDWRDFRATGQNLGTGNGLQTGFQLRKQYSNTDPITGATSSWWRDIKKPKPGTAKVYLNGVLQSAGYTLDVTTGLVSFAIAPAAGVVVTADCEFDVPVRFDVEDPPLQFDPAFGLTSLSNLKFVEQRL